ncbi:MAG: hypothetical protein LC796_02945 [Acidobacteria bacterium]|nr:hypothetical protein [Acidobacteriota bacterium]MCA1610573.1 hypothetical protein [Acidobacteriota bacterium]
MNVAASHTANQLQLLLLNRFVVIVNAGNPRTGRFTAGTPIEGNDRFGCFSLPDFTEDPTFPEIIVRMADATALPPPFGGASGSFIPASPMSSIP